MTYDFDEIIDRRNTDSLKYDFAALRGKPEGILPLWVADMDFRVPPFVTEALMEKSRHGIFGYSEPREDYWRAVKHWFSSRFGWEVQPEWLVKTPGVVFAICAAIRALTNPGDPVLIQQPVYHPFAGAVIDNGRKLVVNRLLNREGRYSIDFEDFEQKIIQNGVKLFILCSPHNPIGRVWTRKELMKIGDICKRHGTIVISDEIHADFVYPGFRHLVFSDLAPEFADFTVTCTAPTKTFNLAGLQVSNIFVPNEDLRKKLQDELTRVGYSHLNTMGIAACRAAYAQGGDWVDELNRYLAGNLGLVREYLKLHISDVKLVEPEGTYLVWLDFSALGLNDRQLDELIVNEAGLWLNAGTIFGQGGEGFQRVNIACPRAVLEQALERLAKAIGG